MDENRFKALMTTEQICSRLPFAEAVGHDDDAEDKTDVAGRDHASALRQARHKRTHAHDHCPHQGAGFIDVHQDVSFHFAAGRAGARRRIQFQIYQEFHY